MDARVFDLAGLQRLIDVLAGRGFTVLGPRVERGAIALGPVATVADLPVGWGDDQDAGRYRLRRRDDQKVFGFASGAQSAKPVFFPAETLLWRGERRGGTFTVADRTEDGSAPYALIGVRSCDLAAVGIQDTIFLGRMDSHYAAARRDGFVVAVTCSDPGGTCFCMSMGTGPRPGQTYGATYDLSLTELLDDDGHRFVAEVGSERGRDVLDEVGARAATGPDVEAADTVAREAAGRMGRRMDTAGLKELLYAGFDSARWDEVAGRCFSCANCTLVCPTCFCSTVEEVTDLAAVRTQRNRLWDSCFDADHSYLHGGAVRASTRSRYRQWMTHKLASWVDQFGMSGCVGCGRCITWCPAAIDITEEAAALRREVATPRTAVTEEA